MSNKKNRKYSPEMRAFLKALILTLAAISLILIGYFTAGYFSGEL